MKYKIIETSKRETVVELAGMAGRLDLPWAIVPASTVGYALILALGADGLNEGIQATLANGRHEEAR